MTLIDEPNYNLSSFMTQLNVTLSNPNFYNYYDLLYSYINYITNTTFDSPVLELDLEETFEKNIISLNSYYKIIWSINHLNTIITTQHLISQEIEISDLEDSLECNEINQNHLKYTKKEPIIICEMPHINPKYIIVDGNHRLKAKCSGNVRTINGFILPIKVHAEAIKSEFIKNIVKIHFNMFLIANATSKHLLRNSIEKDLFPI